MPELQQAGDDLGEVDGQVLEVDQHVHQEEPADDALLDVLDVDAALGHVGGELGDDALLVLAQHADDRQYGLSHEGLRYGTGAGRFAARRRREGEARAIVVRPTIAGGFGKCLPGRGKSR